MFFITFVKDANGTHEWVIRGDDPFSNNFPLNTRIALRDQRVLEITLNRRVEDFKRTDQLQARYLQHKMKVVLGSYFALTCHCVKPRNYKQGAKYRGWGLLSC
jgi:hypothetical protein